MTIGHQHAESRRDEIRMLAVTGCLGYGFEESSFARALELGLDFIATDAGSSDPGPYYLGQGLPFSSPRAIERDLRIVLKGARAKNIPVLIGSAGGGGGIPHVAMTRKLIEKIAKEENLSFKLAVIESEPSRDLICERLRTDRIKPLGPVPELDEATVRDSVRIVAMMGAEPLQRAIGQGADVVLAGRCSDSALFAAIPLMRGFDPGLAWHLGKTIECASAIVRPKIRQDCVIGILRHDHFLVEPAHAGRQCTPETVASHTMYENPSPYEFVEPAGMVDTRDCSYTAIDDRVVEVRGSKFTHAEKYTVKLEGAALSGYRAMSIAGIADPILIDGIDAFSEQIHQRTREEAVTLGIDPESYTLTLKRYGLDAVMGEWKPPAQPAPVEIGLLIDVVAADQARANEILAKARYIALHTQFEGRLCTAGNLAFPFSPSDLAMGPVYRFSAWHTMELDDPLEIFPISLTTIVGA